MAHHTILRNMLRIWWELYRNTLGTLWDNLTPNEKKPRPLGACCLTSLDTMNFFCIFFWGHYWLRLMAWAWTMNEYYNEAKKGITFQTNHGFWAHGLIDFVLCPPQVLGLAWSPVDRETLSKVHLMSIFHLFTVHWSLRPSIFM